MSEANFRSKDSCSRTPCNYGIIRAVAVIIYFFPLPLSSTVSVWALDAAAVVVVLQAVLIGFVLSAKIGLDMLDPAGGPKKPKFEVTQEDVQVEILLFASSNLTDLSYSL